VKATPSLRLSLAAKQNDHFTLTVPERDSVTFSTARYGFDINRIDEGNLNRGFSFPVLQTQTSVPTATQLTPLSLLPYKLACWMI
jgi:hypothetical protein